MKTGSNETDAMMAALREMGEWSALGFCEMLEAPWPRAYGRAFRRLYESMPVRVRDDALLMPCEPLPYARGRISHGVWSPTGQILNFNHNCGWCIAHDIVKLRKTQFPQHTALIDALLQELAPRLVHFGGYTHSNPDIRRVVDEGFLAMQDELRAELAAVQAEGDAADPGEYHLLLALEDYAIGVAAFHRRAVDALAAAITEATGERSQQLSLIHQALHHAFLHPATTFLEGLLAVHFTWMLDGCDSIGRVDQALGPLFERDLADGRLDLKLVRTLLDEWFHAFEFFNGWNLQVGGSTPDGRDGWNRFSRELIAACGRNHLRRPNVAFRVATSTPDEALIDALRVLRDGSGRPALYNDDLYVKCLLDLDLGLTPEDAREFGFGGCTETMIAGLSNVGSLEGYLNLAKALELALHDGCDPRTGERLGPRTGYLAELTTFEAFCEALQRQIQAMTERFVTENQDALARRFHAGDPKLYRTFFTRDCVRRRRSFEAGGARYNWCVVSYHGIANLIDSLSSLRKCLYEERSVTAEQLLAALAADFEGFAELRRTLSSAPRFGNDDAYVDEPGAAMIAYAWRELTRHASPRGGRYLPSCILFTTYQAAGASVGATPDGRRAGDVLTDSVGPAQGRDRQGPTSMLHSVNRLPLSLAIGTPVLNLRLHRQLMATERGLKAVAALVRGYFAEGGLQIQLSVLDRQELLAAQQDPESHRDLIVRIGGYSEYFVALSPELQESVIARTEHTL